MKIEAIGLVGYTGCGKTTTVNYLNEKYAPKFTSISTGDISRNQLKKMGLPETHENLQKITHELVQQYGDAYITLAFKDIILSDKIVLIDALRRNTDIAFIKEKFGKIILLAVNAGDRIRYERLLKRKRNGDVKNLDEFSHLNLLEQNWGGDALIQKSDFQIINEGTLSEFQTKVDNVVNGLIEF